MLGELLPLEAVLSWLLVGVRESLGVRVGLRLWWCMFSELISMDDEDWVES